MLYNDIQHHSHFLPTLVIEYSNHSREGRAWCLSVMSSCQKVGGLSGYTVQGWEPGPAPDVQYCLSCTGEGEYCSPGHTTVTALPVSGSSPVTQLTGSACAGLSSYCQYCQNIPPSSPRHVQEERRGEETEKDQQAGSSECQAVGEAGKTLTETRMLLSRVFFTGAGPGESFTREWEDDREEREQVVPWRGEAAAGGGETEQEVVPADHRTGPGWHSSRALSHSLLTAPVQARGGAQPSPCPRSGFVRQVGGREESAGVRQGGQGEVPLSLQPWWGQVGRFSIGKRICLDIKKSSPPLSMTSYSPVAPSVPPPPYNEDHYNL